MCVAERLLALEQGAVGGQHTVPGGEVVQVDQVPVQPLPVGPRRGQAGLDLVVPDDPALRGVDEEHPARLQPPLLDHLACGDVHHADLAGHHHQVVARDPVPAGPEAVAIQDGADHGAVCEGDRGRAVPGLHEGCVVLVEGPALVGHLGVVLPRFRDHHQDCLGKRVSTQDEEL